MYMYVYMYVCMYVCMYVYIYIYIYIYIHIYTNLNIELESNVPFSSFFVLMSAIFAYMCRSVGRIINMHALYMHESCIVNLYLLSDKNNYCVNSFCLLIDIILLLQSAA